MAGNRLLLGSCGASSRYTFLRIVIRIFDMDTITISTIGQHLYVKKKILEIINLIALLKIRN